MLREARGALLSGRVILQEAEVSSTFMNGPEPQEASHPADEL